MGRAGPKMALRSGPSRFIFGLKHINPTFELFLSNEPLDKARKIAVNLSEITTKKLRE